VAGMVFLSTSFMLLTTGMTVVTVGQLWVTTPWAGSWA
jgi:hypothetical protein